MSQALVPFTNEQLSVIRTTVAKTTTEDEFKLFIEVCKYHNLNPFARQIYAVVRTGNSGRQMSIQTSIDGYRLLAERSGKYAGQIGPEWCGEDGKWVDVWLSDKPPAAARIGVLRKDFAQPTWGVAKHKSYAQNTPIWTKMPDTMLAKCAEALALRKAFPAEMSGIYTAEEMAQADNDAPMSTVHVESTADASGAKVVVGEIVTSKSESKPVTATQLNTIKIMAEQVGETVSEMPTTYDGAKEVIAKLNEKKKALPKVQSEVKERNLVPSVKPDVAPTTLSQTKAVLEMIAKAKIRAESLGLTWDTVKSTVLGGDIADSSLVVEQVAKINGAITKQENNKAS